MFLTFHFGVYDILLIAAVVCMGTSAAYIKNPQWKSFILLLPFPSSLSALAIGKPVDSSFIIGLFLVPLFFYIIRKLYDGMGINIIVSIIISALVYCLIGFAVFRILHDSMTLFTSSFILVNIFALFLHIHKPRTQEEGYKSTLPVYVKVPIIAIVIIVLLNFKNTLGGFMALFPMAGVVSAYEVRHCMNAVFRQIPVMISAVSCMFGTCYFLQDITGLYWGIIASWCVYMILLLLTKKAWMSGAE
ncbi:MAG: hypothetical protein A2017_03055 [Lentisphaerae bacterium GWF2_44_16]|nr:MAG: hypothetical protein A2017_03055 [Lentisphaerae bacterium GWF2_44_16]